MVPFWGYLTLRSYTYERGHLLVNLKGDRDLKLSLPDIVASLTGFMYPSGVFSKIFNEHSGHYSTIPPGSQTVLKKLTFLALY